MNETPQKIIQSYIDKLQFQLQSFDWTPVINLFEEMRHCWERGGQVFICGNGGSAANAIHLANDYLYGVGKDINKGLKVQALSANAAVITCLANDISYSHIYSEQLSVQGSKGDILLVLSGSGQSANIIEVIKQAQEMDIHSFAILGFKGGACKNLADTVIHFPVDDMQVAEDLQMIVGHMLMQYLSKNPIYVREESCV